MLTATEKTLSSIPRSELIIRSSGVKNILIYGDLRVSCQAKSVILSLTMGKASVICAGVSVSLKTQESGPVIL